VLCRRKKVIKVWNNISVTNALKDRVSLFFETDTHKNLAEWKGSDG